MLNRVHSRLGAGLMAFAVVLSNCFIPVGHVMANPGKDNNNGPGNSSDQVIVCNIKSGVIEHGDRSSLNKNRVYLGKYPGDEQWPSVKAAFQKQCDALATPEQPQPIVTQKYEPRYDGCDVKTISQRLVTTTTPYVYSMPDKAWVAGTPVVTNGQWEVVRGYNQDELKAICNIDVAKSSTDSAVAYEQERTNCTARTVLQRDFVMRTDYWFNGFIYVASEPYKVYTKDWYIIRGYNEQEIKDICKEVTSVKPYFDEKCTLVIPEDTDAITYSEPYYDDEGVYVVAAANGDYTFANGEAFVVLRLDTADLPCGTSGIEEPETPTTGTTTPSTPTAAHPQPSTPAVVTAKAAPATSLPLPAQLPETGSSAKGILVALIAAISTYGAVYFAQGKRRYE